MTIALFIIINHFFADFIFQSSKMATRKSVSNKWLTIHVLVYTLAITPIGFYLDYCSYGHIIVVGWGVGSTWCVVNLVLHWITDYFTSRLTGFLYKKHLQNPTSGTFLGETWMHWFFVVIGLDQVIHYTCLFVTYQYLILK